MEGPCVYLGVPSCYAAGMFDSVLRVNTAKQVTAPKQQGPSTSLAAARSGRDDKSFLKVSFN